MLTEYSTSPRVKTSTPHAPVITPSPMLAAVVKTLLVDALGFILAWRPGLAICLGRLVLRLWPHFRRA